MNNFIGKEVEIFPSATLKKYGIIQEITPAGVVFIITRSCDARYNTKDLVFIAFSTDLIFSLTE